LRLKDFPQFFFPPLQMENGLNGANMKIIREKQKRRKYSNDIIKAKGKCLL
jgi:hypothetical protein